MAGKFPETIVPCYFEIDRSISECSQFLAFAAKNERTVNREIAQNWNYLQCNTAFHSTSQGKNGWIYCGNCKESCESSRVGQAPSERGRDSIGGDHERPFSPREK